MKIKKKSNIGYKEINNNNEVVNTNINPNKFITIDNERENKKNNKYWL